MLSIWRKFIEGDTEYLSVVYKSLSDDCGGYYISSDLEPGDLYIPLFELGKPMVDEL